MLFREKLLELTKTTFLPDRLVGWLFKMYSQIVDWQLYLKYGDRYFFRNVAIETSTFCNRGCSYCPNSKFPTPKLFLPEKLYQKIIQRLVDIDFGGSMYFHFYNEPLLDTRLADFIVYAKKRIPKAMVRIFTNGDFLTEELMKKLVDAGVSEFTITQHPPTNEMWGKRMKELQKKYGKYMLVQTLEGRILSNRGGLVSPKRQIAQKTCTEPLRTLQIDYQGNVILCCNDFFRKHKFGNLEKEDILTIWRKESFASIRRDLRVGIVKLPICQKCLKVTPPEQKK